nr:hypothetical protein [uncultured Carboxylicivirga sp.]
MIELFVLIYLSRKVRKIINAKTGLRANQYVLTLILLWFSLELLFGAIGMKITSGNIIAAIPIGMLGAAIGGYLGYRLAVNAEPVVEEL